MGNVNRLDINLARRPFTNETLIFILVGSLAAGALGLTAWNVYQFVSTGSQVAALADRRQALQEERRDAEREQRRLASSMERARSELLNSRAAFANTIIQAQTFSWTRLFNELEQVMPLGIRLLTIRPRVDDGLWVRLTGVARNTQAFWELQENLQKWPVFGNVYPDAVQPSAATTSLGAGELLISLEMEYFPDARLQLGLPLELPAADDVAADADPATGGEPAAEPETPLAAEAEAADGASDVAAQPEPEEATPVIRPSRRGKKRGRGGQRRVTTGVERVTPLPPGAPGMKTPDITGGRMRKIEGGGEIPVAGITPDGRLIDADGNEVSIDDIINQPGGIRPGPSPEPGTFGAAADKDDPLDEPEDEGDGDDTAEDEPEGGRDR
jgi:Tfp pilus assembly protein PilN